MEIAALLDQCSNHLKQALTRAWQIAATQKTKVVTPLHLLQALQQERGSIAAEILRRAELTPEAVQQTVNTSEVVELYHLTILSPNAKRALQKAVERAAAAGHVYVGTEHLLHGLLAINSADINFLLQRAGVKPKILEQQLEIALRSADKLTEIVEAVQPPTTTATRAHKTPALDFFGVELTRPEVAEKIDPVIGRATEIERLIHILGRRTKNNPLLLGEPGVGKTAIVEGLAKRILAGAVPPALLAKKIYSLDLGLMIAGTVYRGEFEGRIKQLIDEVKTDPNIILFIDEVHAIVGTGSSSGGNLDAANLLKPALARGEIHVIGATTFTEFKKHIEHDAALERRFQPVIVREPTATETENILQHTKERYERFHGVGISASAIPAAVHLAHKYFPEKFFPDKAIDLLDEGMSALKINSAASGAVARQNLLRQELRALIAEKETAIKAEDYERATEIHTRENAMQTELKKMSALKKNARLITAADIEAVVARIIGRPISAPTASATPTPLYEFLHDHLHGQDDVLRVVSLSLVKAQLGLQSATRPLASFLFAGSSGVGKTELAKLIATALYDDPQALIRVDMSEFSESHSVSRLLGAPAGYVGYRESTTLADRLRRQPLSVILFDDVDKAHPEVVNVLLQMLEDGRFTDAAGKEASVKQCVIILTYQLPVDEVMGSKLGFGAADHLRSKEQIRHALYNFLRPELLNRLDQVLVFRTLTVEILAAIAQTELQNLRARLAEKQITFTWSEEVLAVIAQLAFEPKEGARRIRQIIEQRVEQPLLEKFVANSDERAYCCAVENGIILLRAATFLSNAGKRTIIRKRVLSN